MQRSGLLISRDGFGAVLAAALRLIGTTGLTTRSASLLSRLVGAPGLRVDRGRIRVDEAYARDVLRMVFPDWQRGAPAPTPRPPRANIIVSARAYLFADHHTRKVRLLTRADVVRGTKLISALRDRNVRGTVSGTPQDAPEAVQGLDQYLIGCRFSRSGGHLPDAMPAQARPYLERMREAAEPGYDRRRRSYFHWMISPLRIESDLLEEMLAFGGDVTGLGFGSMPSMGMTGPVDPVGVFTLSLAECLGATAVLHRVFPRASLHPPCLHPQPVDLHSGLMMFGSMEWNRLMLLKRDLYQHLGFDWTQQDSITCACMPDPLAQIEKASAVAFGVAHGFRDFVIYPLSNDEVWSDAQCLMDVEMIENAWDTVAPFDAGDRAAAACENTADLVAAGEPFAASPDTVAHMREYYRTSSLRRHHSAGQWRAAGLPDPLSDLDARVGALVAGENRMPRADSYAKVVDIHREACRAFCAEPLVLD
jgi:trimethylamine:corrinoid methyltransferase-like protein